MQSFNSYADNLCDWCGKRTRRWVDDGSGGKAAICDTHILFFGVDRTGDNFSQSEEKAHIQAIIKE